VAEILKNVERSTKEWPALTDRAAGILKNVDESTSRWPGLTDKAGDLLTANIELTRRLANSISIADSALTNLDTATKPWANRSETIVNNLDESAANLNKTLKQVREFLRVVDQEDGTLRRVLSDPSLYNNLNDAACMLARLMPRLDRVLKDIEVFADKIARHPESLGVGGAVRPSSGLKEAPSSGTEWHGSGH
jgi:hypothetical protein